MIQQQDFFTNKQFTIVTIVVGLVIIIYAIINGFVIGGTDFVLTVTSYASPAFSMLAAVLAVWTWHRINARDVAKKVWAGIAVGLTLWALGESTSAGAVLIYGEAPPAIRISDISWLAAYLVLALALLQRLRTLGVRAGKRHWALTGGLILGMAAISTYFFVWPAFQKIVFEDVAANLLRILFTSGDFAVMLLSLLIFVRLGDGRLSAVWQVLSAGLALRSFGDLMYYYATSRGLYWPYHNHITLVSIMSDIPYVTSYLVISLGVYMQQVLFCGSTGKPVDWLSSPAQERENDAVDVLVSINALGKVTHVSNNFTSLVKEPDTTKCIDVALQRALGLDPQTEITLIYEIFRWGYIRNRPLRLTDRQGQPVHALLTAAVCDGERGIGSGAELVLRAALAGATPETEVSVRAALIYAQAGVLQAEGLLAFRAYCEARVKMLHALVMRLGGENIATALVQIFNRAARRGNWPVEMAGAKLLFSDDELDDHLIQGLSILMKAITLFAQNAVGYQAVEDEIHSLETHFAPGKLQMLDNYGIR